MSKKRGNTSSFRGNCTALIIGVVIGSSITRILMLTGEMTLDSYFSKDQHNSQNEPLAQKDYLEESEESDDPEKMKDSEDFEESEMREEPAESFFDSSARKTYFRDVCNIQKRKSPNNSFNLETWDQKTSGGLMDKDRIALSRIYGNASSVFEWGLGESTYMAGFLGVPRYSGIDSDANYVSSARSKCPDHFRLSFADIGPTGAWGWPKKPNLTKIFYNYVIAPLVNEHCPFDVYMVDGRFRVACGLNALLHASKYGHDATILMHDYQDAYRKYTLMEKVCDVIEFDHKLVVFKRKPNVTDEFINDLFLEETVLLKGMR